jgi:hypothetical protein
LRLHQIRGAEIVGFLLLMGILAAFGLISEGFRRIREGRRKNARTQGDTE